MTIYDEQLRGWLTARSFKLGWIPRTIVFEEDFWKEVNREMNPENSIEEALRNALQKRGYPQVLADNNALIPAAGFIGGGGNVCYTSTAVITCNP